MPQSPLLCGMFCGFFMYAVGFIYRPFLLLSLPGNGQEAIFLGYKGRNTRKGCLYWTSVLANAPKQQTPPQKKKMRLHD